LQERDATEEPIEPIMSDRLRDRRIEARDARAKELEEHLARQAPEDREAAWRRVFCQVAAGVEVMVGRVAEVEGELDRRIGGLKKGPEVAAERRRAEAKERELKIEQAVARLFTKNPLVLNKQIAAHLDEHQVEILGKKFYEASTMWEFAKKFGAKHRASIRVSKK